MDSNEDCGQDRDEAEMFKGFFSDNSAGSGAHDQNGNTSHPYGVRSLNKTVMTLFKFGFILGGNHKQCKRATVKIVFC